MNDSQKEIEQLKARIAELEAELAEYGPGKWEPPWDEAPDWAVWCTVDSHDEAWWHQAIPSSSLVSWHSLLSSQFACFIPEHLMGNWRKMKYKRPN